VRTGCLNNGGVTGIFCSSTISISAIFKAILPWEFLARPVKQSTAMALPKMIRAIPG
jgi:hypothetical protein